MNLHDNASSSARRSFILRLPLFAVLAATTLATPSFAAGPVRRPDPTPAQVLVSVEPDESIDDLAGHGSGPIVDPGVDPLAPADGFSSEVDPIKPIDDGFDVETGESEIWLDASHAYQLGANLTGFRIWDWNPNPLFPSFKFRVDPTRGEDFNAKLTLHLHALPGYRYTVYFNIGNSNLVGVDGSVRVAVSGSYFDSFASEMQVGSGWTTWNWINGPEAGDGAWTTFELTPGSLTPSDLADWEVTSVRIVVTPIAQ